MIAVVNDYFEHQGRTDTDLYLGTCKKEDAFLLRVLEITWDWFNQSALPSIEDTLLRLL